MIGFSDAVVVGYRTDPIYDRIAKKGGEKEGLWSRLNRSLGEGLFGKEGFAAVAKHAGDDNPYMYTYDEMREQAKEVFWASTYFIPVGEIIQGSKMIISSFRVGESATAGGGILLHYTNEAGYKAIMESEYLIPSIGTKNARYGPGQYLTDLIPGKYTIGEASRRLFGIPWNKSKLTHFIEIDVTGLNVIKNAPFNFLIPGVENLPIGGRIVNHGLSVFK